VAGHEHRPALRRQPLHQVADPQDPIHAESVHRLVEHEDRRIPEQGCRDPEPLAHAKGKALRALVAPIVQADELKHPPDPAPRQAPGLRQAEQMIMLAAAPVHGLGVQQCPHFLHRLRQLAELLAVTEPRVGRSRPRISRIVVVLPAPFGPRKPVINPGSTRNDSRSTATLSP
jgi:hypothetical protein